MTLSTAFTVMMTPVQEKKKLHSEVVLNVYLAITRIQDLMVKSIISACSTGK